MSVKYTARSRFLVRVAPYQPESQAGENPWSHGCHATYYGTYRHLVHLLASGPVDDGGRTIVWWYHRGERVDPGDVRTAIELAARLMAAERGIRCP